MGASNYALGRTTADALRKRGLIESISGSGAWMHGRANDYIARITDAGRAALNEQATRVPE